MRFLIDDEGRLARRKLTIDALQVYIPEALRSQAKGLEHYPKIKGHANERCMYGTMKWSLYW